MLHNSTFNPMSRLALDISNLFVATLLIAAGIFALVVIWLLVAAIRFRARPGDGEPRQTVGFTPVEIAWTAIPALILLVLFGFTVATMNTVEPGAAQGQDIVVIGHQWWWEIRYAGTDVVTANEIHLPVGKRMLVRLESADVVHNLWIPQLGGKMDLVPGQSNHMYLEADRPGTYLGVCSEFCGTEHAWMLIQAIAQAPDQYAAWLRRQQQKAAMPRASSAASSAAMGERLFGQLSCAACHAIFGTAYNAQVGPNLTHVGSRTTLAAGLLLNTPANMAAWLRNPQALKPGVHMPNLYLSNSQVRALTAYLEGLR